MVGDRSRSHDSGERWAQSRYGQVWSLDLRVRKEMELNCTIGARDGSRPHSLLREMDINCTTVAGDESRPYGYCGSGPQPHYCGRRRISTPWLWWETNLNYMAISGMELDCTTVAGDRFWPHGYGRWLSLLALSWQEIDLNCTIGAGEGSQSHDCGRRLWWETELDYMSLMRDASQLHDYGGRRISTV